jgi:pyridoxine 5-phosphate synthase
MGNEPDPLYAAAICELNGADSITIHLREDRRHIQDRDLKLLRQTIKTQLNLEMANTEEIVNIALETEPEQCTLVPEKRQEVTTEGGLDVVSNIEKLKPNIKKLKEKNITVSLFIDPDIEQIKASKESGATHIELHTGAYSNANKLTVNKELDKLIESAEFARKYGLIVNAGHGLNYTNIIELLKYNFWNEFNIGHSIISRAVFSGLGNAVKEMRDIMNL